MSFKILLPDLPTFGSAVGKPMAADGLPDFLQNASIASASISKLKWQRLSENNL